MTSPLDPTLNSLPSTPSSSVGLSRKWRSRSFKELVGQESVVTILKNSLRQKKLAAGYIFSGTRGVGKTSVARIFAKALRCHHPEDYEPCHRCEECQAISNGRSFDVLEMDGASHTGVDSIRDLREKAYFTPSSGHHKIYIIDEVHMLSTSAFNALLKILEEPPEHLIFILATTDLHKVPITVQSRCIKLEFSHIQESKIIQRLQYICDQENLKITQGALELIAREGNGSLRDALSLLEQVASYQSHEAGAVLDEKTVYISLGLLSMDVIFECLEAILQQNPLKAVEVFRSIYESGADLKRFMNDLIRSARNLAFLQLHGAQAESLLLATESERSRLHLIQNKTDFEKMDFIYALLSAGLEESLRSSLPRYSIEFALARAALAHEYCFVDSISNHIPTQSRAPLLAPVKTPATSLSSSSSLVTTGSVPRGAFSTPAQQQHAPSVGSTSHPPSAPAGSWKQILVQLKRQAPALAVLFEKAAFQESKQEADGTLVFSFQMDPKATFAKQQLLLKDNFEFLCKELSQILGSKCSYKITEVAGVVSETEKERKTKKQQFLESEPMRAAQDVLGAHLDYIEMRDDLES